MNKKFPQSPGVYIMRGAGGDIIYIGKAANLSKRVGQYFQGSRKDFKLSALLGLLKRIDYIVCESERDALILEDRLIKKHQPFFNIDLKDGKSYARVKITDEDFPRILMVRSKIAGGGRYFGPYPKSSQVKSLLRYLWQSKLLPLRPCRWEFSIRKPLAQKKINSCVYFHTGQCPAPCAGKISFKNYRKIVRRAVMFFEGKFSKLEREFFTLMKKSSAKMDYEASAQYRNFIDGLKHIGERIKVSRYKDEELERAENNSSAAVGLSSELGLKSPPRHIESFDVSTLFGRQSVGSCVCFMDGEKHHAHYRRFKIKSAPLKHGADDTLMIYEIVGRRLSALKNADEPMPDLILIDGGSAQLNAAARSIGELSLKVEAISLAKKNEEIFALGKSESVKLSKSCPALKLLMQIRDETHRFAISYHRKLRAKTLLEEK